MGFNLIQQQEQVSITIDSLTGQMMQDLIACYAADIPAVDVEARYLLTERTGVIPDYPIIPSIVIDEFYGRLDMVKQVIIDSIIGNYHTGLHQDNRDGLWLWGTTPTSVQELKDTLAFIIFRDAIEIGEGWLYDAVIYAPESIRPLLDGIIDLSIAYTSGGDYDVFVSLIKSNYSFTQE